MSDFAVPGYHDRNRAFMQAFLARNTLTLEGAKVLIAGIESIHGEQVVEPNEIGQAELDAYVAKANMALSLLDLEIRNTLHQRKRERVYALVNTTSDPLTQLATTYSADEIAFVKKLLDAMFDGSANRGKTEAMCLSTMDAVQLVRKSSRRETQNGASQAQAQKLSTRDAEELLDKLQDEGWLEKSPDYFYSLSPRALLELKEWLVDTYNEAPGDDGEGGRNGIKFCHACKDIITVGQRCSQRECPCRIHDICTQNFFRAQRSRTCPLCETEWDGEHYVGEKAITTSERFTGRRSHGGPSRGHQEHQEAD